MTKNIPQIRFRLDHTYLAKPELIADPGPAKSILVGGNYREAALEAIYVGKHAETPHRDIWMDVRGAHVLYVMGKRRSGKSYTLGMLAESLVSDAWMKQGRFRPGVVILDTMNVFLTMPYRIDQVHGENHESMRDFKKWKLEPTDLLISLFAPPSTSIPSDLEATELRLSASELEFDEWCGLFGLDPFTDPMGHLLGAVIDVATKASRTRSEKSGGGDQGVDFRVEDLIKIVRTSNEASDFPQDTRSGLIRRLEAVVRYGIFGAPGIDVHDLVKPGEISVLLLRDLEPEIRAVTVALIVKRVMRLRAYAEQQERVIPVHLARAEELEASDPKAAEQERKRAADCLERAKAGLPRCWLIIDEAHNYIPSQSSVPSRKPLKKYVDEGRNLGLSIVVATQQPSGLDPSIQRNADLLFIHSLSHHDDIVAARGMINCPEADEVILDGKYRISGSKAFEALVRRLPVGYALISSDRANRVFPILVRPRNTYHGGADY